MRSYFVPSRTGAGDDRVEGVRVLARGLKRFVLGITAYVTNVVTLACAVQDIAGGLLFNRPLTEGVFAGCGNCLVFCLFALGADARLLAGLTAGGLCYNGPLAISMLALFLLARGEQHHRQQQEQERYYYVNRLFHIFLLGTKRCTGCPHVHGFYRIQTGVQYIYMHIVPQRADFVKGFFILIYNILIRAPHPLHRRDKHFFKKARKQEKMQG